MYEESLKPILCVLFFFIAAFGQSTITDANWVSMPGTNKAVSALVIDKSGILYAGGNFDSAGGVKVNHVARWDGRFWSALGNGTNSDFVRGSVICLAVDSAGDLFAGGFFDTAGGIDSTTSHNGTVKSGVL